jgi:hypothetical protein
VLPQDLDRRRLETTEHIEGLVREEQAKKQAADLGGIHE